MIEISYILLIVGLLLIICVASSTLSSKVGIPVLLLFILVGLFFDGGNYISPSTHNYEFVQSISIIALIIIMFSGGINCNSEKILGVAKPSILLSTLGVFITTFIVGFLVHLILGLDLMISLLLGAIISSTDAAAIFSIFKSSNLTIKNDLDHILEFESATNDPMAYILVSSFIFLILNPQTSLLYIGLLFIKSLVLGTIFGIIIGRLGGLFLVKVDLLDEGLYPVFSLAIALLSFAVSEFLGGNGFLAVFLAALALSNKNIKFRENQLHFFDGLTWVMQIIMFILLGVFTMPNELIEFLLPAFIISFILIFVARPIAVFVSLSFFHLDFKSKLFLSWAGIKGAIPIVFAFYPLVYNISQSDLLFNVVLIVTCISVLIQGSTIGVIAEKLGLTED